MALPRAEHVPRKVEMMMVGCVMMTLAFYSSPNDGTPAIDDEED